MDPPETMTKCKLPSTEALYFGNAIVSTSQATPCQANYCPLTINRRHSFATVTPRLAHLAVLKIRARNGVSPSPHRVGPVHSGLLIIFGAPVNMCVPDINHDSPHTASSLEKLNRKRLAPNILSGQTPNPEMHPPYPISIVRRNPPTTHDPALYNPQIYNRSSTLSNTIP